MGCWGVPWIGIVDKLKRSLIKIECPLQDETQCTDLIPLPNFNPVGFPFILIRNSKAVNLVNLATFSMHRLLTRYNQAGSFQKTVINIDKSGEICLVYMTKDETIMEAKVDPSFISSVRDIIS